MLVEVIQEGMVSYDRKVKVKDGFLKHHYVNEAEYKMAVQRFICDESEVEDEAIRLFDAYCENYGYKHHTFVMPHNVGWYNGDRYSPGDVLKPRIRYVKDMKMTEILQKLTGEQFAQFRKEMGIGAEAVANG